MTFSQRLLRFLMGASIGLVFIAMAFGPRAFSCNYFPNARVLEEATAKNLQLTEQASQFVRSEGMDSIFLYKQLFGKSKIDFDKSDINGIPCRTYLADYSSKDKTKNYKMEFEICKETSKLISISKK
ncbi:hypothetical protein [Faecalibacter rhinopitheci]|uniref:DUF4258 domain-containing protein n=1 Tax=Faecalibacter rhinopitheci TaxID=2779678 RepID=A0A8J7KHA4_9FLAO|nr:hypothetical protein [Faecalibacter rhinopitheci]MBF0596106.1 hypothetical protein [Faecalibacter rhinopitheci]MBQ0147032.1 hypothetical protein [Candidatus Onthonaster equi]